MSRFVHFAARIDAARQEVARRSLQRSRLVGRHLLDDFHRLLFPRMENRHRSQLPAHAYWLDY